jgi:hypothetical protein
MSTPTHIPFSDSGERKPVLQMIAPWLIAAVVLVAGAFLFLHVTEEPPVAQGKITKVFAVEQPGAERVIVGAEIDLRNAYDKEIIVRGINAKLVTADGKDFTDQPAAAGEHARYFAALPDLKQSSAAPLAFDTKLTPGQQTTGLIIVGFPVTKQAFDQKKSFDVKIDFYGMKPVTFRQ